MVKNIAIFASGTGTNAENIIRYFSNRDCARVVLVLSNRSDAYVLKRAEALSVRTFFFERNDFYGSGRVTGILQGNNIDFIVLAGFLWLVPGDIIEKYKGRIINIHPALLPLHGGRGMYGERVHRAVIQSREKESGISIHYVNNRYDEGDIIFQARCTVEPADTAESLARKVHELEYRYLPGVIEDLVQKLP
ncbi:MAG: phosphoribosylglycinamide formyltransferase [Bacteroidales bacterium]|nr:phosphoribosylglycinamide formyltransferase [Bacteroidales bacterium]